ncbi:mCG147129 [Mus musculus]|nr:mCG147129 [Mus musculus]
MPQGSAALSACRCCPCGARARLLGRRCPRRWECSERVKVCVAGAAGAAAAAQDTVTSLDIGSGIWEP